MKRLFIYLYFSLSVWAGNYQVSQAQINVVNWHTPRKYGSGKYITPLEHILEEHGSNSHMDGKGRFFSADTTMIQKLINDTLKVISVSHLKKDNSQKVICITYPKNIGTICQDYDPKHPVECAKRDNTQLLFVVLTNVTNDTFKIITAYPCSVDKCKDGKTRRQRRRLNSYRR